MVKRVLDAGVQTVMFPFVQTVDEARRAVAACKYTAAGLARHGRHESRLPLWHVKDYFKVANDA